MLTERLNELLDKLNATGAEIAKKVDFDRTNISRIKSGKRIPHPDSATAYKLINGIYLFADNKNDLTTLCSVVGSNPTSSAKEIKAAIKNWLYQGYDLSQADVTNSTSRKRYSSNKKAFHHFGERLNSSMLIAGLSNVQLSKLIHADASLISRYRNGVRTPVAESELSSKLISVLFDRLVNSGNENELADLMHISASELDEDSFALWLYGKDEQEDNVQAAENILGIFDSFPTSPSLALPDIDDILRAHHPAASVYIGTDGLREAVIRFLSTAIKEHVPNLYLYSDMDQSWMTQDTDFLLKWASLMFSCVKNSTHINIIHNLDRSLEEMSDAIRSWLPLYMSGMIESYYCRKQRNPRFSHTIFLIPGIACIRSFDVTSAKSETIYHYYTENNLLEIFEDEYSTLLKSSSALIHPLSVDSFPIGSDIICIKNVLSLATMPEELAKSFNNEELYKNWQIANSHLLKQLESSSLYECIPLADDTTLSDGKVPISWFNQGAPLFYTAQQYSTHIKNIIALSERFDSYRFYPIPEAPFNNIDLLISNAEAKITPANSKGLSFALNHPSMCTAFKSYARTLMEQSKIDRNSLRKMLECRYVD